MTWIWNSRVDVAVSVRTITIIHARGNGLPANLVAAYKEILLTASKGLVTYFYESIAEQCPAALPLFQDVAGPVPSPAGTGTKVESAAPGRK